MAADRSGEAVEMCKAKLDALDEEIDGIERALIEAKAAYLPDAAAKVSLDAWRLAGAIVDDGRDLLPEVANNFGEGKISHGDLVTLRHVLELVEPLPTNVAPVEFEILARGQRKRSCRFCAARSIGYLD
ncbi:MAG: hypothetical protein ABSD11_21675 [Methylocella sp.]|jgi:hypothetical protein